MEYREKHGDPWNIETSMLGDPWSTQGIRGPMEYRKQQGNPWSIYVEQQGVQGSSESNTEPGDLQRYFIYSLCKM